MSFVSVALRPWSRPRPPRHTWFDAAVAWLTFLWASAVLYKAHLFFVSPPRMLHHLDEAYINAFAWRMNTGHMLPFVDAVSHRGPMMYWVAALAQHFGSPASWLPLRVCALVCQLSAVAGAFWASWRAGRAYAGAIAALAMVGVYVVSVWAMDGLAYSGELLSGAFMMGALVCLAAALDPRQAPSAAWLVAGGVLASLNAFSKQLGALVVVTLGVWVLATAIGRPGLARRTRLALPGAYALGVALPAAAIAARYAAAGALDTLVYYLVTYNAKIYMAPYSPEARKIGYLRWLGDQALLLGMLGTVAMWAVTRPMAAARSLRDAARAYDAHGFVATVGASALGMGLVSNASLRGFMHYYMQAVPFACLLFGAVVDGAMRAGRSGPRDGLVRAAVATPLLGLLYLTVGARLDHYRADIALRRGFIDQSGSPLCQFVRGHSSARDSLFLWGFDPQYYTACARRPASRFVFTTFVAGYVPWFDGATPAEEEARAVPGSRDQLIADLEREKPPVILDMPGSMGGRSMRRYSQLAAYLSRHYCTVGTVDRYVEGLVRRDEHGGCPPGSW